MSIVNRAVLNEVRDLRQRAVNNDSYQSGYHLAQRALNIAIGMLEQIDTMTQGFKLTLEKK